MTVWSKQLIVFNRRWFIHKISLVLLVVVFITSILLAIDHPKAYATDKVIGFSARLKNSSGGIVPDGYYNVDFRLYNSSSGGTPLWSETYYDSNGPSAGEDNRVRVINGYMNIKLGSQTSLPSDIDWGSSLWLTMNIGGTSQIATIGSIPWDGEMSPRIRLTAVPYALGADAVGGKKADELVQLGQGAQTDNSNNSSVHINKTGSGNLVQLQSSGSDAFVVNSTGSITLGASVDQSISVGASPAGVGHNLTVKAGTGSADDNNKGGSLVLQGGSAGGLDGEGGNVVIDAGTSNGSGSGGSIALGLTNASNITIGNSGSTTTVDGSLQSDNLDSSSQTELNIGKSNATVINLGQDTTVADGKTLTVNGDTTVKSTGANSTTALQVQNADGTNVLSVDTLNNQVSIGASDSSGTLLVLDTKSTSGDPLGTNGAMYYNSNLGKFRCFESSQWKDCITPLPVSKVLESDVSNSTTTPSDVSNLTYTLSPKTKYYYKFVIIHQADSEMTGIGFGVKTPTSPTMSNWCTNTSATLGYTSGHWGSYCGVGDASSTTSGETGMGTSFNSILEGYIETDNDGGDLTLRFKSESANKTTIKAGSFGILQVVQ